MRVRHKTPTLVSMWMLDVFCCALGCVTLLWLLNTRQAGSAIDDLKQSRTDLTVARTELDAAKLRLNAEIQQLTNSLAAVRTDKDELGRKLGIAEDEAKAAEALLDATKLALNSAEKKVDATAKELAMSREKVDAADDALRKKQKDTDALMKKLAASTAAADDLAKLIREKDTERVALEKRLDDLNKQLDDVDAKLRASRKELDTSAAAAKAMAKSAAEEVAAAKAGASKTTDDLTAARGQIKDLTKKLTDANATIIDLQGDKAKLADKFDRVQKETEAKFAGITMTGERVVFLIDMSGSMDKVDERTVAPHKWPTVAETVAKVMRSVPRLDKYQVILFSRESRWLSGNGEWLPFEGEKSAVAVKDAILKVKPEGDTNLYAGLEQAFSLRESGLDTIYLFSDGLPTSGPGLTAAQEKANPPLRETERSELLSKYIRTRLANTWNRTAGGKPKVKIHSIGFFYESPDVGAFLWALSRENDGSFVGMSKP